MVEAVACIGLRREKWVQNCRLLCGLIVFWEMTANDRIAR